jgi:hypothetical protein
MLGACCLYSVQFIVLSSLGAHATRIVSPNKNSVIQSDLPILLVGHYAEGSGEHYVSLATRSDNMTSILTHVKQESSAAEFSCTKADQVTELDINISSTEDVAVPSPADTTKKTFQNLTEKSSARNFHSDWITTWPWITYNSSSDLVTCSLCSKASASGLIGFEKRRDDAFTTRGFRNWQKGPHKFRIHETSASHSEARQKLAFVKSGNTIHAQLSSQVDAGQKLARQALHVIITSLQYLAAQGLAIRGHEETQGNFVQLLNLRANDIPDLATWLNRRDTWTSNSIQNEILKMLAHSVQRTLAGEIQQSPYFGIVADGTTDISGVEQLSITVRYVQHDFTVNDVFIGMYTCADSTAHSITRAILDVLLRLQLSTEKMRGHGFDGAANMSGRLNGVQAKLCEVQPKSTYVHCANHSLDLALQEIASEVALIRDSLGIVRDIAVVFRESAKRKQILRDIVIDEQEEFQATVSDNNDQLDRQKTIEQIAADVTVIDGDSSLTKTSVLALCPTRWCVRARALRRVLDLWPSIRQAVDHLLQQHCRPETKTKLISLEKSMAKAKTYLSILISTTVFAHCEDLAKELQSIKITATGAIRSAHLLIAVLRRLRSDKEFDDIYSACEAIANNLHLKPITEDDRRRTAPPPARYENKAMPAPPHTFSTRDKLRQEYFMCLDLLVNEIERRFDQPGLKRLVALETMLSNSCRSTATNTLEQVQEVVKVYEDVDSVKLARELGMLPDLLKNTAYGNMSSKKSFTAAELAAVLSENETVRGLFSETLKIIAVLLVVPASAANAERSFSALRRLKTWFRSTIAQERLTHLAILNCHKERVKHINIDAICQEFVSKTSERLATFGIIQVNRKSNN